ncbi:nuclear transport factor 2 family protein [Thermodesulfobacteriota bacterium]
MTLEELEKRIKVLEDIEEIKQLQRNYVNWVNIRQMDDIYGCFAENAIADIRNYGPRIGKDEIIKLFRGTIENIQVIPGTITPKGGHIVLQPVITVYGNRAKGHWDMGRIFSDLTTPGWPTLKMTTGRHDCAYIREDGKWKFSYLKWTHPWPLDLP